MLYNCYMKKSVNKVINDYIRMVEKIANGRTNVLDFGMDRLFYRGEVHMIKMIGDNPGIYISKMARNFNITRAVVSKTIIKLEKDGFVKKEVDKKDKKRLCLYLTSKGWKIYREHENYHNHLDSPLFTYLDGLRENELKVVSEFLKRANIQIDNHF